ncbi:MAG: penicillin-binding protein 2 [Patescibacteria group bacterium]|jgi:cell division protein FtsI/penicillin-binding protein 2|nr:penicillin-binding protein 2 [Patescibacteria group bacterium]
MKSYHNSATQKNRIPIIAIIFFVLILGIFCRVIQIQGFKHGYYQKLAAAQHWIKDEIPAKRGKIYAQDTISNTPYLLATNQALDLVFVEPNKLEDKDKAAQFLSEVLGMNKGEIFDLFKTSKTYVPIKHKLTLEQGDTIRNKKMMGIGLTAENWRYYPEKNLASSILGFVNGEFKGNYGLEEYFDKELSGIPGVLREEADHSGVKIAFGDNITKLPVDGNDFYLTIDRYIQGQAQQLLDDAIKKYGAPSGQVIVMDPKTGKILALADNPNFDPNRYSEIKLNNYNVFKNSAVSDTYEPGSVFKVITMAAGLDAKKIIPETKYTDTGSVTLNGYTIRNSDLKAHGVCDMTSVLSNSLNTGSTWVQQKLGKDSFYNYVNLFGFGTPTGIELPGEVGGVVHSPKETNDFGYANMSFGQGISTTPLQMITSFSAIANSGKMMKPYIVDKTADNNKNKTEITKPKEIRQVISPQAASDLTKMMIDVVEHGHGFQAKISGYKVAGKTGTAQVPDPNGGYSSSKNIGTFIGFAPASDPKFVVLAKLDEPKGVPWAEESAAPVVGSMLSYLLNYYQIPPTEKVN